MEKAFRTKTGFCHLTDGKIILTRDGVIGNVAKVTVGNNISRILIIYSIISLGLFYFAYDSYLKGEKVMAVFFGLIGLYLIYGIIKSLNNPATPIIERKNISKTTFINGISGLTRSRFEIEFTEGNKTKKRLILLPGSLNNGQSETEMAIQIMKSEKLLN